MLIFLDVFLILQGCTVWQKPVPIFLFAQGEERCRTETEIL